MADDPRLLSDAEIADIQKSWDSLVFLARSHDLMAAIASGTAKHIPRLLDHIAALTEERDTAAHERDRVTKVLRERIEVDAMLRGMNTRDTYD